MKVCYGEHRVYEQLCSLDLKCKQKQTGYLLPHSAQCFATEAKLCCSQASPTHILMKTNSWLRKHLHMYVE